MSPVTGIIDESTVIIDFGKHEGRSVKDVAELDPEFYDRLIQERDKGIYSIRRHRDKTFRLYVNPLTDMEQ